MAEDPDIFDLLTHKPRPVSIWRVVFGLPVLVFGLLLGMLRKVPAFRSEVRKLFELNDDQLLWIEISGLAILVLAVATLLLATRSLKRKHNR